MSLAVGGVAMYNKAKYEAATRKVSMALPQTNDEGTLPVMHRSSLAGRLGCHHVTMSAFGAVI